MIDEKVDGFWKKFQQEVSSIIPTAAPQEVETVEETDNTNVDNSVDNVDNYVNTNKIKQQKWQIVHKKYIDFSQTL